MNTQDPMYYLILIFSIICFIQSTFWLVSKVTGPFLGQMIAKAFGLFGTILPLIYWLKITNII